MFNSGASLVTLSISASDVRVLEVRSGRVTSWDEAPLEPGTVRGGRIVKPSVLAGVIDELFSRRKLPRDAVHVSLSGASFTYRLLEMPDMNRSLLQEAMVRAATREIPVSLDELYLTWQPVGSQQGESHYVLLGTPREPLDSLIQALNEAKIKHYQVDLRPLALARLANQVDAVVVALEADLYNIVVLARGVPAVLHTVIPRTGDGARLEDNITRLADEINKTLKFHNLSYPGSQIEDDLPLFITGALTNETAVSEMLPELTGRPLAEIAPPLQTPTDFPVDRYGVNLGLALRQLGYHRTRGFVDVNLNVIRDLRQAVAAPLTTRTLALSLLLVAVAAAAGFLGYANQAQMERTAILRQNLADFSVQLRVLIEAGGENQALQQQIDATKAETANLQQIHQNLLGVRGELVNNFKLTDRARPNGVTFESINVDPDAITVTGYAEQPDLVVSYARALARDGFANVRIVRIDAAGLAAPGYGFAITIEP